ncbi:terpene synthase family protein [Amycolatopsis sp. cmx-11-12]|uniref:terpene synthase family protein n=1 Tax=Amycolatopsis sp. cmx-11-12 TaxID=2785795 RepID=UPI00391834F5
MARIAFDLPFRSAGLPDLTDATEHHHRWLLEMGLLTSTAAVDRLMSWGPHRCAAHFHPYARGADLLLATDFYGWMMAIDGQFDGPMRDRPDQVRQIIQRHVAILDGRAPSPMSSAEKAFADIWERMTAGMSSAWPARAGACFARFLQSYTEEAVNRRDKVNLHPETYLALRTRSGAMDIIRKLAERINDCELPQRVTDHEVVRQLCYLSTQIIDVVQDVLSLDKEVAEGEMHNLVLVLQRHHGWDEGRAVDHSRTMVREWVHSFHALQGDLPAVCAQLDLSDTERARLYRYVEALRACMRGNHDWCSESPRYAPDAGEGSLYVGYLEGLAHAYHLPEDSVGSPTGDL